MEQHAATQQSPSASTELQQVSRQYLEHFNTPQFLAYLQPNTQIIWFGRTLQGVPRLESFLKYLKNCQYELKNVQPAQQCEPFESKQEHFETRRIMPPCKYKTHRLNRVTSTTLKPYAESDVERMSDEEEEAGPSTPQRCVTPVAQQVPAQLTPPTTRRKLPKPNIPSSDSDSSSSWTTASSSDDSSDDTDNEDFEKTIVREAKRPRTQAMPAFSYLRYFPSQKKFDKWLKRDTVDYGSGKMATPAYGEIKYLEMTAFLRCSLKVPFTSPAFKNCDKEIKINMSYRRNPDDNTFVFPMIVYDLPYRGEAAAAAREAASVAMPTRRNLMLEYGNEPVEDDDDAEDESPEPVSSTTEVLERSIETQLNATIRGVTPIVEGDNDTRLSTAITSTTTTTSLLEATNDLVNTLESTDLSVSALRTPIKLSNTPPATPKRKPRIHSAAMASAASLKRLQDSPTKQAPAPKRSAARCLRL